MNLKRISVAVIQFLMISAVIFACPALSQPVIQKKATLSNWKNNLRLFALDRSDNYGGFITIAGYSECTLLKCRPNTELT
jgi:hypothetical protein